MKFQILVDSSADIDFGYLKNSDIGFGIVPLTIYIGNEEFIDDEKLDTAEMVKKMNACKEKMRSSCPSPESWLEKYEQADYTFVVTMTSKLSGTYNSAVVAQQMAKNKDNIYVFDTKSTSGSMELVVDEIVRLIRENLEFKEIIQKIENCPIGNLSNCFKKWEDATQIKESDELPKDKYAVDIKVKQRYIVPLVEENNQFVRIDTISESAKQDIDNFLNYKPKKYAYLDFNF